MSPVLVTLHGECRGQVALHAFDTDALCAPPVCEPPDGDQAAVGAQNACVRLSGCNCDRTNGRMRVDHELPGQDLVRVRAVSEAPHAPAAPRVYVAILRQHDRVGVAGGDGDDVFELE